MNFQNKTLIILSPGFPPDESARHSSFLPAQQNFVRGLNRNLPKLEIILFAFQFPTKEERQGIYQWQGNTIIPFHGEAKSRLSTAVVLCKAFVMLLKLKRKKEIIGIISFWCGECCFVGSWFSKLFNYKHFCWLSGQDARATNKLVKYIRPKPYELVAMSDFLMDEFSKNHHIRPQYVIPNAIDTSLFFDEQIEKTIDILGAGNLVPLKQYHIFVEVVAQIKKQIPALKAILCGDGILAGNIKQQAEQAGLENTLSFAGRLPHKEVLKQMQKTKVFVHTSNYEGLSNVCIEALYAGAHVISFIRAMNHDIPHWHIVSTKEEMINTALSLLQNEETEYTSVCPFDMNKSAKKFIELFAG